MTVNSVFRGFEPGARLIDGSDLNFNFAKIDLFSDVVSLSATANNQPTMLAAMSPAAGAKATWRFPAGTWPVTVNVNAPAGNYALHIDPNATFTGGGLLRFGNLMPFMPQPIMSLDLYSKSYGSEWNGHKNIMQRASFARSNVVRGGASVGPAVLALYGSADAAVAGAYVWASNNVAIASADTSQAIAVESDSLAMSASAIAVNTLLVAAGDYPSQVALQIQSNNANAVFRTGIFFNNRQVGAVNGTYTITTDVAAVSGDYIKSDAGAATRGINFAATTFSTSEWDSSNLVLPTSTTPDTGAGEVLSRVWIQASGTGNPFIHVKSADDLASANLNICAFNSHVQFITEGKTGPVAVKVKHVASVTDRLTLSGGTGDVTISTEGSTTNSSVAITGKGTGGGKMRDGGSAIKIQWNTTGLGFFATTPVAKQTVTGSQGGNAALASLLTALAAYGIITDSTTA